MAAARFLSAKDSEKLVAGLFGKYKDARYYLNFSNPLELMVAAILSAQTRDETVNRTTPELFSGYRTADDYARADPDKLASRIKSISFAGNKARNIISACRILSDKHGGRVPKDIEDLVGLPGIGRKTANTILINAYGIVEGIPVDTWVIRLSYRLGLSRNRDPEKIEEDLMRSLPRRYWPKVAYVLKTHGKSTCQAVPRCSSCPVRDMCPKNGVTKRY